MNLRLPLSCGLPRHWAAHATTCSASTAIDAAPVLRISVLCRRGLPVRGVCAYAHVNIFLAAFRARLPATQKRSRRRKMRRRGFLYSENPRIVRGFRNRLLPMGKKKVYTAVLSLPPCHGSAKSLAEAPAGKRQHGGRRACEPRGIPLHLSPLAQRGTSKAFHSTADTRCACRSEMSEHIRRVRAVTARA